MTKGIGAAQQEPVERILFVCTANICRSPMAEVMLRSILESRFPHVQITSAGFMKEGNAADKKSIWAMNNLGIDLSQHRSRRLISALEDKPDLILTMARGHLRSVAEMDTEMVGRSFTLKEFVELASIEGKRRSGEPMADYVTRVGAGRMVSAFTSPKREHDIEDPLGRRKAVFATCSSELRGLLQSLSAHLYPTDSPGFPRSAPL